jgi:hypothetical protein
MAGRFVGAAVAMAAAHGGAPVGTPIRSRELPARHLFCDGYRMTTMTRMLAEFVHADPENGKITTDARVREEPDEDDDDDDDDDKEDQDDEQDDGNSDGYSE